MVGGRPEGVRGAGGRGEKGKNQDNYTSIINKINFKKEKRWSPFTIPIIDPPRPLQSHTLHTATPPMRPLPASLPQVPAACLGGPHQPSHRLPVPAGLLGANKETTSHCVGSSQIRVHPEPQNVSLFKNRVFQVDFRWDHPGFRTGLIQRRHRGEGQAG